MTGKGHALSRDALIRTLTAYSGITTEDGTGTTTLVDSNLIDNPSISPSGIPEKTILILAGDARGEDKGAIAFDNSDGKITLQGTGFSAQIKAGTIFRILNISSIEIDVANIAANLGAMADAATADNLSDITTTSVFAKLRRLLLRFSANAFSSSIDGSARTNLKSIYTALGVLLGTRAGTPFVTFPSATASALEYLKGQQIRWGGFVYGDITTYTDTTHIASTTLGGFETGFFIGWYGFLIKDDGGAGASPQGARSRVTAFTTTTGAITLASALPAAGAVGDQIMLVHPVLLDAWNMRGGTETLESIDDELDAMMDMAKVPDTRTISVIGTEETITALGVTGAVPFYVAGIWLGMENMAAGDVVRWRVFVDWDDASIADQLTDDEVWTFGGVQGQKWTYMPLNFWVTYEIAVKVTQLDGTAKVLHCVLDTGQRGS